MPTIVRDRVAGGTAAQRSAEVQGLALDQHIEDLLAEKERLQLAAARIVEIDAELVVLNSDKAALDQRRPPRTPPTTGLTDDPRTR